jgi:hypothetical protein
MILRRATSQALPDAEGLKCFQISHFLIQITSMIEWLVRPTFSHSPYGVTSTVTVFDLTKPFSGLSESGCEA